MTEPLSLEAGRDERLAQITPFILTYDEEPNIARCLERLDWASQIIVVDSGSRDQTLELIANFSHVRIIHRAFDTHARQSNFALSQIESPWALSLDADYILTPEFCRELREGEWDADCAYFAPFRVCVRGRPLRASLYPPRAVLFARENACYEQDGHTQRLLLDGRRPVRMREFILHDDRKSRPRWLRNQRKYADLEVEKIRAASWRELQLADRIRRIGWLAPLVIVPYALFVRGLILNGRSGIIYAFERAYAELILSFRLFQRKLRARDPVNLPADSPLP